MGFGEAAGPDGSGSEVPAEAGPPGGRRGTAVLDDLVVPPWLRMPSMRFGAAPSRTPAAGPAGAADREGGPARPVTENAARRVTVHRPAVQSARPRVVEDTGILGLSRLTRGRVGSRLFTLFFVAVFTLIALQMVLELLHG